MPFSNSETLMHLHGPFLPLNQTVNINVALTEPLPPAEFCSVIISLGGSFERQKRSKFGVPRPSKKLN